MLHFIKEIKKINNNFSVVCLFNNNETRPIDLSGCVEHFRLANDGWASRFAYIKDFKTVQLDSYGTLQWDNQLDFCPEVIMSTPVAA